MAALVLGTRVVTLLPRPAAGVSRDAVFEAVRQSPRYLRLMEAWRWSTPLWRAGIVSAEFDGEAACERLDEVYADIREDEGLADLRPLTREVDALRDRSAPKYLDAVSADLLRGGPDPGISIPINAALERFSARHALVLARGPVSSVAQRAEARLGLKIFSIGLPMLLQTSGERILALREDLAEQLDALRAATAALIKSPADESELRMRPLQLAAAAYSAEFAAWTDAGFARGDDESGKRIVAGFIGLTCMSMPEDAVLRSSRAAVRSITGFGQTRAAVAPAQRVSELGRFTLIVREMNVRPESDVPRS